MKKAKVIDSQGAVKAEIDLPESVFGYPAKGHLVYEAAVNYLANQRRGTASTKTRAEVKGSNRKPWKQKGTGRARAGATRNPLWRKGGTTFGPKPRDYSYSLSKESKRNALRAALSAKQAAGRILILENLALSAPKTKEGASLLKALKVSSALVVDLGANKNLFIALRNIPKVKPVEPSRVNTHDVVGHEWFVAGRDAFTALMERLQ
ncbi:MAG: 50S ribosomal protein L4 [Acidobacteriota bacterium]|jgi:large subunit ribosomal protein L4|nr:50S ribosomal protein L4 [Acidobacteriota bacterium]OQB56033.1 MAG: 50S ribosomal protein L4 [Candidatus Aminicenantes bacterium ADurb.Bin147]HNQ79545.1 50S ribosomal protein L4 [Candidatus Aminicenantes bacterium]MDD8010107.1 50S ribosomal protein L4 [Acidobacteriota bacterium]MDD8029752.1 50S ribosomal protein L4 [Acidobacteriota bacterium]